MLDFPHRRLNPLTGEWVLVSPHRSKRPWQGQVEKGAEPLLPAYDPTCYLCPGNQRAGGVINPKYTGTFVFDNDFASLLPKNDGLVPENTHPLFSTLLERGICRVVCFSPRHDLTLPEMDLPAIESVLNTWTRQSTDLGSLEFIQHVQVFENKGAIMGCSNPHPHSQIWANERIPNEPAKELGCQLIYYNENDRCLLSDYADEELRRKERVVTSNDHFTAVVPFWAVWPFEILVIANQKRARLNELTTAEITSLASLFKTITTRYDNLFETSFPYSMGFHQAPYDGQSHPEWTLHAHFYPPLLRSATVRKFMVGYELLSMPQRDITPEIAAERLRSQSDIHYKLASQCRSQGTE